MTIGPISILGAVPGSTLCLLISGHNADLVECCAEEVCFTVPDCDGEATGACCLPDGTCITTTMLDCQSQQGLYIGDNTPCSDCDTLTPIGACCLDDGTCVQVSTFECGILKGVYLGDNTLCIDCDTQTPVGACCLADGTCVQTTIPGCEMSAGTFLGANTNCADCVPLLSPCDFNSDGFVNVTDLLQLLASWGDCAGCPTDVNSDGFVNVTDLLTLLSNWGP